MFLFYSAFAGSALSWLKCRPAPGGDGSCAVSDLLETSEKFLLSVFCRDHALILFYLTAERARVGLAPLPGMKGTDYINASYIMVRKPTLNYKVKLQS